MRGSLDSVSDKCPTSSSLGLTLVRRSNIKVTLASLSGKFLFPSIRHHKYVQSKIIFGSVWHAKALKKSRNFDVENGIQKRCKTQKEAKNAGRMAKQWATLLGVPKLAGGRNRLLSINVFCLLHQADNTVHLYSEDSCTNLSNILDRHHFNKNARLDDHHFLKVLFAASTSSFDIFVLHLKEESFFICESVRWPERGVASCDFVVCLCCRCCCLGEGEGRAESWISKSVVP